MYYMEKLKLINFLKMVSVRFINFKNEICPTWKN